MTLLASHSLTGTGKSYPKPKQKWEYVKGSEADFEGAPEWATHLTTAHGNLYFSENFDYMSSAVDIGGSSSFRIANPTIHTIIAERRKVDNLQSRTNDANLNHIVEMNVRVPSKEENDAYNKRFDPIDVQALIAERRKVDNLQSRVNDDKLARDVAAVATLEQKGYEWCGGTLWKPPIGPVPDFILKEQQAFDTVQRPAHYNQSGIECIDAIAAAVKGKNGIEAAYVANVIKYLWRYELKNGVEDVRKAQWYLDRLVKELSK